VPSLPLASERVMLVGDHPPAALLAQPDGKTQPVVWLLGQILGCAAPQQGESVGHLIPGRDVQRNDLERSAPACHWKTGGQVAR